MSRESLHVRAFEAWLASRVIALGAKLPTSHVSSTVWFAIKTTHIGLIITPECTVALLTIPFLVATALFIWYRARVGWPLLALGVAMVSLVAVNQLRILGIVWFVQGMGFQSGFYWGHTLVGSMITIIGLATTLAVFVYLAVCRGRPART